MEKENLYDNGYLRNITIFFLVLIVLFSFLYKANDIVCLYLIASIFALGSLISVKQYFIALVFFSFLHGLKVDFNNITIRPEQIGLLFLPFILRKVSFFKTPLDLPLAIFLFLNLFSSIFFSPIKALSLRKVALLAMYISFYFVIVNFIFSLNKHDLKIRRIIQLFLCLGISAVLFGVVSLLFSRVFGLVLFGVDRILAYHFIDGQGGVIYRIFATMQEPNIYGSTCCFFALVFFGLFISRRLGLKEYSVLILLGLEISLLGLLFSYTRGAWLAYLLGVIILSIILKLLRLKYSTFLKDCFLVSFVFSTIVAIWFILDKEIFSGYKLKFWSMFGYYTGTGWDRIWAWSTVLKDIKFDLQLFFGHGTQAHLNLFHIYEDIEVLGIGNFFLDTLHSTGIIGLSCLIWIHVILIKLMWKVFIEARSRLLKNMILITFVSCLCLTIAYQFTQGYWLSFPWILMALIVAFSLLTLNKLEKYKSVPIKL
ncbi:MAG: hypothetical protein PHO70_04725 [Candidatus Omnitrophica bacterium]|nr:hypothetical protein [Candidatus Omnitrophota bacterium]